MLVLTRKVGDVIAIGDNIKIVVMAIKGKQVRLGVQADRSTVVHREEVYQKIQQEVKAALQSDVSNTLAAGALLKIASAPASASSSGIERQTSPQAPAKSEAQKTTLASGAAGSASTSSMLVRMPAQTAAPALENPSTTAPNDAATASPAATKPGPKARVKKPS